LPPAWGRASRPWTRQPYQVQLPGAASAGCGRHLVPPSCRMRGQLGCTPCSAHQLGVGVAAAAVLGQEGVIVVFVGVLQDDGTQHWMEAVGPHGSASRAVWAGSCKAALGCVGAGLAAPPAMTRRCTPAGTSSLGRESRGGPLQVCAPADQQWACGCRWWWRRAPPTFSLPMNSMCSR